MITAERMIFLYKAVWLGKVWSDGIVDAVDAVLALDFKDHRSIPQFPGDREGHKMMAADWHRAFPDMKFTAEDIIIAGAKVVGRYVAHGHHLGTFTGIPPSGACVTLTGIDIFQFGEDLVTDWWHNEDIQGLMDAIRRGQKGHHDSCRIKNLERP